MGLVKLYQHVERPDPKSTFPGQLLQAENLCEVRTTPANLLYRNCWVVL